MLVIGFRVFCIWFPCVWLAYVLFDGSLVVLCFVSVRVRCRVFNCCLLIVFATCFSRLMFLFSVVFTFLLYLILKLLTLLMLAGARDHARDTGVRAARDYALWDLCGLHWSWPLMFLLCVLFVRTFVVVVYFTFFVGLFCLLLVYFVLFLAL